MLKVWLKTAVLAAGFLAAGALQAAPVEGKDYKTLPTARAVEKPGKLEVIEFFWYGCGHCANLEPFVEAWEKQLPADVNFRRAHVVWPGRADVEAHARLFASLQALGIEGKYQQAVFDAVQKNRIELRKEGPRNDWLKKQGIDQAKFKATEFSSANAVKQLEKLSMDYGIDGVPTFVINGKYVTSPAMTGRGDQTFFQVVNELLAMERSMLKKPKK